MNDQILNGGITSQHFSGAKSLFVITHFSGGCCPIDYKFIRIDENGDIVYERKYDSPDDPLHERITGAQLAVETSDGSTYFTVGRMFNGIGTTLKVDGLGNIIWELPAIGSEAIELSDGNLLFVSRFRTLIAKKVDPEGNLLSEFTYRGIWFLEDYKETPDGGFVFLGSRNTTNTIGVNQTFFLKTDGGFNIDLDTRIDLSLRANISPSHSYRIHTPFEYELVVSNNLNQDATNIEIDIPKPDEVVYLGGNEYTATSGTFSTWRNNVWCIDRLESGQSDTLQINYFLMSEDRFYCYAQVINANEEDINSTPSNGTCCDSVNEDDEAVIAISPRRDLPDLFTRFHGFDDEIIPGEIAKYRVEINNSGSLAAVGDFSIGVYFSDDREFSVDDIRVGWINTGNLPSRFREIVPGSVTVPEDIAPGNYFILLIIDENDLVEERSEINNLTWNQIEIKDPNNLNQVIQSRQSQNKQPELLILKEVYPSPAIDEVIIKILAKKEEQTEVQIFDLLGRLRYTEKLNLRVGVNELNVNISSFPAGHYSVIMQPFHPYLRKARFVKVKD